jgi:hypothetical protein
MTKSNNPLVTSNTPFIGGVLLLLLPVTVTVTLLKCYLKGDRQ